MHNLIEAKLGIRVSQDMPASGQVWSDLAGLAARRNPKRAHLIVSKVLGKHIPAPTDRILDAGAKLGQAVVSHLAAEGVTNSVCVLGYAETATALGHMVAAELDAPFYAHTTRDLRHGLPSVLSFDEQHSHAVRHHLCVDPEALHQADVTVLVDDELTTGSTAWATIRELARLTGGTRFVVAALLDMRGNQDAQRLHATVAAAGIQLDIVSLARANVEIPDDVLDRAAQFHAEHSQSSPASPLPHSSSASRIRVERWTVPDSGRHGWTPSNECDAHSRAAELARELRPSIQAGPILVLGCEEFMYVPLLVADALRASTGLDVWFQSTTRSPAIAVAHPDYAIRDRIVFPSIEDPERTSYLYNVGAQTYSDIVVVTADPSDLASEGLLGALMQAVPSSTRVHHLPLPYIGQLQRIETELVP